MPTSIAIHASAVHDADCRGDDRPAGPSARSIERTEIAGVPVFVRSHSPDASVARRTLGREFSLVTGLAARIRKPKIVLDLGGYIGTAAVAFATRIPDALVVTVEPSPDNFRLVQLNTAAYPNIVAVRAAVASTSGRAPIFARHTGEWGHTLVSRPRDCAQATFLADVPVVTVEHLLATYGGDRVPALVKCDIEGGEVDLFSRPDWVDAWAVVTAELHDRIIDGCTGAWDAAFGARPGFVQYSNQGEKRVAVNESRLRSLQSPGSNLRSPAA